MRIKLRTFLRTWLQSGGSAFFTSHNLLEAEHIVDRFAFLANGRITAVGTAKDLKERFLVPVYHLEVSDTAKAIEALRTLPSHELRRIGPTTLQLTLMNRGDAREIARRLSEADVDLLELRSIGTMEDVFQRATRPWPSPPGVGG
jgi:ABC-type multidrug transport system ATPase subunit